MVWHRLLKNKVAVIGMVILAILVLISIFGPLFPGLDPNEMNLSEMFQGPSAKHWFGTDDLGRDIFARIIYGGRYSLALGFIGSVFTALIGTVCGTIMGAAGLSYIGLGIPADIPEWGAMISAARSYSLLYPHMMIFPGLMIAIVVLAINLFGDGLRDAMDPKLKK